MEISKYFYVMMIAIMTAFSFSACSDDKDEPVDPNDYEKNIVGTWTGNIDEGDYYTTCTLTFTSSGSFSIKFVDSDDGYSESGTGTYTISGKNIYVGIRWDDDYEYVSRRTYEIISLSSKTLVLNIDDFDGNITLTR